MGKRASRQVGGVSECSTNSNKLIRIRGGAATPPIQSSAMEVTRYDINNDEIVFEQLGILNIV